MTSTHMTNSGQPTQSDAAAVIDAARLRQLRHAEPNLRLLDVRTGGEYETVRIPGSYNVPLDTLGQHVEDLADVEHPVVLVCQTGGRATQAHSKLTSAGKHNLHILDGGIAGWQASDGDVVHGDSDRWAMDRQVRGVAGTIVVTAMALSTRIPAAKWIAGGIGAGLTFSTASNTCAMGTMLSKLPYNKTDSADFADVLADLNRNAAQLAAESIGVDQTPRIRRRS